MAYYTGDYYRGDPGFLSFMGKLAGGVASFIPGVGPALSSGMVGKLGGKAPKLLGPGTEMVRATGSPIRRLGGALLKHPGILAGGSIAAAGAAGLTAGHIARKEHLFGLGGRKRRRMRATNPKALRRALRRAYAFERIALKTIRLVSPHKKGRFGGFKKPRKRVC